MSSLTEHLNKLREERVAREKARIHKLRELNFKKYNTNDSVPKLSATGNRQGRIPIKDNSSARPGNSANSVKSEVIPKTTALNKPSKIPAANKNGTMDSKNVNGVIKRPITAPVPEKNVKELTKAKPKPAGLDKIDSNHIEVEKNSVETMKVDVHNAIDKSAISDKGISQVIDVKAKGDAVSKIGDKVNVKTREIPKFTQLARKSFAVPSEPKNNNTLARKSFAPRFNYQIPAIQVTKPTPNARKSMQPHTLRQTLSKTMPSQNLNNTASKLVQPNMNQTSNVDNRRQSVFERLYQPKPKIRAKPVDDDIKKMQNDPQYIKKLVKNTHLILNKRHTVFEPRESKSEQPKPVRRSISAAHFKRIGKNEINNCIHKWSSVDEKLDKLSLQAVNEDENIKQDKIISAVKSERKKVKFQTPVPYNYNTPKPEELQRRLQNWLKKRGKSLDSYHHLQCFGISHLTERIRPFNMNKTNFSEPETVSGTQKVEDIANDIQENTLQDSVNESHDKFESFEDDNKENEPLDSVSDNDSYNENMNDRTEDFGPYHDKWRKPSSSFVSDSMDLNETRMTQDTTLTGPELHHVDELLLGALNDLTEMLREGFDWEQSASWLRAIREQFPNASDTAAYWECRAALEERRGDLSASLQCWEEAVVKGTERSVAEANLDQILDKFMQLKISPGSGRSRQPDPKMLDVKNVFKSTVIRFAVQQAKLRQSTQETPKFTVTPVRRSGRLSARWTDKSNKPTPLRICTSVKQAGLLGHPITFVPNDKLVHTP